jgi:hypothetical protein
VLVSGLEAWCALRSWVGRLCVGSLVQWHSSGYVGLANLGSESEICVGSRVHLVGVCISFEKNFYRLPFTPPPLWFTVSVLQVVSEPVRVFVDSNQSKIQGWHTRNGVRVLHTSMARTTRCGVSGWLRFSEERVRSFRMSRWTQSMSSR